MNRASLSSARVKRLREVSRVCGMTASKGWGVWAWIVAASVVCPISGVADGAFHFCAIGDMPYYLPDDYERYDNVIASLNAEKPAFTVHVGDTKSGSSWCSDENLERTLESFRQFDHPLIYTPGDNEWTDCHRPLAGEMDPLQRLAKIRELFFATDRTLGGGSSFE